MFENRKKVSFYNIASEASYVYILLLEVRTLISPTFRAKNDQKSGGIRVSTLSINYFGCNEIFLAIFKQCEEASGYVTECSRSSSIVA